MIQVNSLSKYYGDRAAIENIQFSVGKGEVVGFLGPNGAGKSTTMKIITGFMPPSEGSVTVGGFDVFEDPVEVKKLIGYLPEVPPLYADMKVRPFLRYVAELKSVPKDKINSFVDDAISAADISSVADRYIQNLSKGFCQRVGFAQALVAKPEVLILDEPSVGLDPKQVSQMRDLISRLKGHHTIILSTHILPEVQMTCDRVVIINQGHIVAEDSIDGLSRKMSHSSKISFKVVRNKEKVPKLMGGISGVVAVKEVGDSFVLDADSSPEMMENISKVLVENNFGLLELRSSEAVGLEEIFIRLTRDGQEVRS